MEIQWPLVFFTLLAGLGAGTFAMVAISEWWGKAERARLPGAVTVLVALAAAGVASVLHLGHPERIFNALGHVGSGIFFEMLLIGLTGLAAVAYILALRAGSSAATRKGIATVGLVLAAMLAFIVGYSYVLPSRPAWNTLLLPLLFIASAAVLGCFCFYLWAALRGADEGTIAGLNRATLIALAAQAVLLIAFLVHLAASPFPNPTRSPLRLLAGDLALVFWVGLVLIGLLVPGLLAMRSRTGKASGLAPVVAAALGLICVVVGGIALRAPMYVLGTSIEQFF